MAAHMHPDFHLLLPDALREPLGWDAAEEGTGEDAVATSTKAKAKPSKEIRVEAVRIGHRVGPEDLVARCAPR